MEKNADKDSNQNTTAKSAKTPNKSVEPQSQIDIDIDELAEDSYIIEDFDYEDLMEYFDEEGEKEVHGLSASLKSLFAGTISAIVSNAVTHPLNVIKMKSQSELNTIQKAMIKARLLYADKGIPGFWNNHSISQLVGTMHTVTLFWTFEQFRSALDYSPISHQFELCNFLSGFAAGTMVMVIVHPIENIGLRVKARNLMIDQLKPTEAFRKQAAKLNFRGLYQGFMPSLLHMSPFYGCEFLFHNIFFDLMVVHTGIAARLNMEESTRFVSSALSGMVSTFITYPLDTIRFQLQANTLKRQNVRYDLTCRTYLQCAGLLLRQGGIKGFYQGLVPGLLRSAIFASLQLGGYYKLRQFAYDEF